MTFVWRWTKVLATGLLVGLVAALFMTLLIALLRIFLGIPLPVELGGDRILPTFNVREFLQLLSANGGPIEAKRMAFLSGWGGQLAFGAAVGVLYALIVEWGRFRDPERQRRWGISRGGAIFVTVAVAVIWAVTLAVLWPTLGTSNLGLPPRLASVATALGFLLSYTGYGVVLVLVHRLVTSRRPLRQPAPVGQPIGRRAFLAGAGGVVLAAASGGLVRKLYKESTLPYDGMGYGGIDLQPITPNDRFYVVTKNIIDPRVRKSAWRLQVGGMVNSPTTFDFDDLAEMPSVEQEQTLMCISNSIGGHRISNAVWTGVPPRTLIEETGPESGVVDVILQAADGYTHDISYEKAMEDTTLVAYEMNGEPLSDRHGYPARVLVPGYYGEGSVKWVTRIELFDRNVEDRYYGKQGWKAEHFHTWSRLDPLRFDPQLPAKAGEMVTLKGVAFSGDRDISKVEVSADDGRSWQEANIDYSSTRLAWVLWSYDWHPSQPGDYKLVVRATDGDGQLQTEEVTGVKDGVSGYHKLPARIEA
jgi:DMSO/TMAO reductase YedYZ molybdopterin-dependent catalytic subunit